ncbi:MAG: hypothetical protein JXB60_07695 [Candidatus Cloacimonetes bacterium]|nr:hypothetical protein [Candidatus Cloacimonadota bacterium]
MKKISLLIVLLLPIFLSAYDFDFYGSARIGMWYIQEDEDFTGGESRLIMSYNLYTNSRFGANLAYDKLKANVEFGFKWGDAYLRKIYGEYDFDKVKLLVGQDYTGFSDLAAQATSIYSGKDESLIAYGAYYDSRNPQIRLTFKNGPYISFMEPKRYSPCPDCSTDMVDALLPRTNIGMKLNIDEVMVHATFGINVAQYNKDIALWAEPNPDYDPADSTSSEFITKNTNENLIAYALALTVKYEKGDLCLMGQFNYGQNIADYGIVTSTGANSGWDGEKDEVINNFSSGGFGQFGYKINDKMTFLGGVGFNASKLDGMDDQDTAMAVFGQIKYQLSSVMTLIPELGMIDDMEDGAGNDEGSQIYFGTKIQVDFP